MEKTKYITCVGYTCSGSSAVNNIFREYNNCCEITPKNECRFLQDPDGISDLEYNLIENPHRLNSGYALKRYLKYAMKYDKRNFRQIFGKSWKNITQEYIMDLTEFKYKGYWHADIRDLKGIKRVKYFFLRGARIIINKFLPEKDKIVDCYNYLPKIETLNPIRSEEEFLNKTRKYCEKLFNSVNKENKEFVIIDQMVPPTNINRYLRYVNNLKVIVVDRDPRDIYIETIIVNDHVLPKDVELFCKVYKESREENKKNNLNIIYIQFEDLIYNYEQTVKILEDFLGEDNKFHSRKHEIYSIEKSKNNTCLWKKYPEFSEEIKYIETELKNYLYNFND